MKRWLLLLICLLLLTACHYDPANAAAEKAREEGKTVVSLVTWLNREHDLIGHLANTFNESQDEIFVHITSFEGDLETMSAQDSLDRAHAEMISNVPDLFLMQSFDAAKLRNAGLITDWYPVMAADESFDPGEYQTHIWELLETNGKLYQLCVSFDLYGIGGAAELYGDRTGWTIDEFRAFLAEHSGTVGTTQERMLQLMLWYGVQFEFVDWAERTGRFETQEFYDWLAFLNELPVVADAPMQINVVRIHGPHSYGMDWKQNGYYTRCVGLPSQTGSGPAIAIDQSFALSSQTECVDACWTFMKWLLSRETQELVQSTDSIPIRRDVWESALWWARMSGANENSLFAGSTMGMEMVDGEPRAIYHPGLPAEEIEYLRDMVANADYVSLGFFDYEDITLIVEEEVLAYLAGDKTAEDCARIIQSRVSTMLAERRWD